MANTYTQRILFLHWLQYWFPPGKSGIFFLVVIIL